jgi:hypothetical protein
MFSNNFENKNIQKEIDENMSDSENDTNLCPISMEKMKEPYSLACGHTFDKINIQKWLEKHDDCPLCRRKQAKTNDDTKKLDIDMDNFRMFDMKELKKQLENINDDDINSAIDSISGILGTEKNSDMNDVLIMLVRNVIGELQNNNNNNVSIFELAKSAATKSKENIDQKKFSSVASTFNNFMNNKNYLFMNNKNNLFNMMQNINAQNKNNSESESESENDSESIDKDDKTYEDMLFHAPDLD